MTYTITIPGEMRGKGRPRMTTRNGFARAYTDEKTINAEAWVKKCAIDQAGQPCLDGAISLVMEVIVAVPASWSKKARAAALAGDLRPVTKPDFDNTAKLVADALNGIIWRDDKQITDVRFSKRYGGEPLTTLKIFPVPEQTHG